MPVGTRLVRFFRQFALEKRSQFRQLFESKLVVFLVAHGEEATNDARLQNSPFRVLPAEDRNAHAPVQAIDTTYRTAAVQFLALFFPENAAFEKRIQAAPGQVVYGGHGNAIDIIEEGDLARRVRLE